MHRKPNELRTIGGQLELRLSVSPGDPRAGTGFQFEGRSMLCAIWRSICGWCAEPGRLCPRCERGIHAAEIGSVGLGGEQDLCGWYDLKLAPSEATLDEV
jgi:hypothetical protein